MMSCSTADSRGARRGRLRVIGGSTKGASQAGLQKQCWLCGAERWVVHYARALTRGPINLRLRSVVFSRRNCTTLVFIDRDTGQPSAPARWEIAAGFLVLEQSKRRGRGFQTAKAVKREVPKLAT